ncbi:MAG TPA: glycoside hydrolase family 18 protein [Oscillospiraceae bacterium]|nr:glycoside hydrolase family 18 protein [Oscillospiraceae bacterium]
MVARYRNEMVRYASTSAYQDSASSKPPAVVPAVVPAMSAQRAVSNPGGKKMVGYYTGYSAYSGYTLDRIPASKLTELNYAFAKIDDSLRVAMSDPNIDLKNFEKLRELKNKYPNFKTLISIGGWDYSKLFSDAALTAQNRENFAQSALDFILKHGFDGVDLDWEYPVAGGVGGIIQRPVDKQNFTLLLKAIRDKLDAQSAKDSKKYYLTIAGAPTLAYLNNIEPLKVAELVDYIFIMAYDLHGPWDEYSDFNAPLFNPEGRSPQYKASVNDGVMAYLNKGISPSKLVLGMPLYGYIYNVTSSANNGLYSPFTSAKSISFDNVVSKHLGKPGYRDFFEVTAKVPYIYGNSQFISYDDRVSIAEKAKYAVSKNLDGVGFWELSQNRGGELVSAAYDELY